MLRYRRLRLQREFRHVTSPPARSTLSASRPSCASPSGLRGPVRPQDRAQLRLSRRHPQRSAPAARTIPIHMKCMAADFFIPGVDKGRLIAFAMRNPTGRRARLLSGPRLHPRRRARPAARLEPAGDFLGLLKARGGRGNCPCHARTNLPIGTPPRRALRLSVRTAPFHGAERGSTPLGRTSFPPSRAGG